MTGGIETLSIPPRPGANNISNSPSIAAPAPLFVVPFNISTENQTGSEIESILADRGASEGLVSPFNARRTHLDNGCKMVKVSSWCSVSEALSPRSPLSDGLPRARGGVNKKSYLELCDLEDAVSRGYEIYTEQHEMIEPPSRSSNPLKNLLASPTVLPPLKRAPYGAELKLDSLSPVRFR